MRKILSREILLFVLVFALISALGFQVYAQDPADEHIIIVGDVSQSVIESSLVGNMKNALKLAVDLAPNNASLALITVDTEIQESTSFLKMSDSSNREIVKEMIDGSAYEGGTNLVLGIEAAVEIAGNDPGRIIMLADISDGALTRTNNYDEMTQRANALASEAKEKGIIIDLILIGTPDLENPLVSAYTSFPEQTGGTFQLLDHSKDMASAVESLYFGNYAYNMLPISGINSTDKEQQIDIALPTAQMLRSRIYVSAATPVKGIRATYAAADLGSEMNTSYAMIDLDRPVQDRITLYLDMGDQQTAKVYLIADYELQVSITQDSDFILRDNETIQETIVGLEISDKSTNKTIISGDARSNFTPKLSFISPSGIEHVVSFTPNLEKDNLYTAIVSFEEYGKYLVEGKVESNEFSFLLPEFETQIHEPTPPKPKWSTPVLIAIGAGVLLIIGAIVFYIIKKKEKDGIITNQKAVQLSKKYGFTGRVQLATVIMDSGERGGIRPFHFNLEQTNQSRITLGEIYMAAGIEDYPKVLEKLWLLPGPTGSIVVKNNSKEVTIIAKAKKYGYNQKLQLFYDDKLFIVVEKDVTEIQLYYRKSAPQTYHGNVDKQVSVSF